jgi:two-component system cell cycle response regulator
MKILIADQDAPAGQSLESLLTQWGYQVVVAVEGREALKILHQADAPKLAILGGRLAGLDGFEVCREVRKLNDLDYTYLMVLLGSADGETARGAVEAGADDCLLRPLKEDELRVRLRAARRILGLRHQLSDAQAALNYQVSHDPLTGLMNRAAILDVLRRELARVRREKSPVGVIKVELDDFKMINQKHGSVAGDTALRATARKLRATIRPYDAIGRFGVEEFLIVSPGSDIREALAQAERLRVAVVSETVEIGEWGRHIPEGQGRLNVTVCLGVAASSHAPDAEPLVRAAEAALRRARAGGPNRVEIASPEELAAI